MAGVPVEFSTPKKFSWFIEGKLAGMAWPSNDSIQFLVDCGIKTIINLTEENPPCYEKIANEVGIKCIQVRVECFGPPTMEMVTKLIWIESI